MSIWNKVLAGLVIVSSLVFFYFALRALKTHQHWRELAAKHEARLEKALEEQQTLLRGAPDGSVLGVRQIQGQIHRLNLARGRAWVNTQPQRVDPATGEATVLPSMGPVVDKPESMQLSVFLQAGPQSQSEYLGDFQIAAVSDKVWQIRPTRTLSPRELGRLQKAGRGGFWIMYERIPSFTPEFLAEMEKPAPAGGAGGEKAPPGQMVDYRQVFDYYYGERSKLHDLIESAKNDLKGLKAGEVAGNDEVKVLETEKGKHEARLAEARRQLKTVADHLGAVEGKRAEFEAKVDATIKENQATARQIAQAQFEAARRIEERTRRTASAAKPY